MKIMKKEGREGVIQRDEQWKQVLFQLEESNKQNLRLQMGEKALTLTHPLGLFNDIIKAPCPPIECPAIDLNPTLPIPN